MLDGQGYAHPPPLRSGVPSRPVARHPMLRLCQDALDRGARRTSPRCGRTHSAARQGRDPRQRRAYEEEQDEAAVRLGGAFDRLEAAAVRLTLASCRGYRLPEPTRQAHLYQPPAALGREGNVTATATEINEKRRRGGPYRLLAGRRWIQLKDGQVSPLVRAKRRLGQRRQDRAILQLAWAGRGRGRDCRRYRGGGESGPRLGGNLADRRGRASGLRRLDDDLVGIVEVGVADTGGMGRGGQGRREPPKADRVCGLLVAGLARDRRQAR